MNGQSATIAILAMVSGVILLTIIIAYILWGEG